MALIRKTIQSISTRITPAEGFAFYITFAEADITFPGVDLNKSLWLAIMDQAEAERGELYPAPELFEALVDVRLLFERKTSTGPHVFTSIEYDDVAALKAAIANLL